MVVEKAILGGEQSLDKYGLQLRKLHLDPLGRRVGHQAPDHLGLQSGALQVGSVQIGDALDLVPVHGEARHRRGIIADAEPESA